MSPFAVANDQTTASTATATLAAAKDWLSLCDAQAGGEPRFCAACISVGGSQSSSQHARGFCIASDLSTDTAGVANFSVANDIPITKINYVQTPKSGAATQSENQEVIGRCTSAGGSDASPDAASGFCLAADIQLSDGVPLAFALANGAPVTGFQFVQVSFQRNAGNSASGTPGNTSCESLSGTKAFAPTGAGFCASVHLATSASAVASFAVANELPIAGLQLLQVSLDDTATVSPGLASIAGAKCSSLGGAKADTGTANGFCLAADVATARTELASFAFANKLPMKGLQFMQLTATSGGALDKQAWGSGSASPGTCVSSNGSTARASSPNGFCLASDLSSTEGAGINIAVANGLPIASMQFLQAGFSSSSPLANLVDPPVPDTDPTRANCQSANGTRAGLSNPDGFCIASDNGRSEAGLASLALANYLPIGALNFLQVPMGTSSAEEQQAVAPRPRGMLVTDRARKRSGVAYRPAVAAVELPSPRYYGFNAAQQQRKAFARVRSGLPRGLAFWINRTLRASYKARTRSP
jgi:hypothetical protein